MTSQRNIRVSGREQSGVAEGDVVTVSVVPSDQRDVKSGLEGRFVKARERLPRVRGLHLGGGQIPGGREVSKQTLCLTSTETIRLIRDGEKGVWREVGGRGRLCIYRYTVTTRMIPALRWAAMRAILMSH